MGVLIAGCVVVGSCAAQIEATHTFAIGDENFLLDGQRLQIRCGEIHFARVPREYWGHRLGLCKAMGLNTVCAYLFWNLHEWEQGKYDWSGQADAAEFCRLAQQAGLWVILRPGPYACAEWEGGGLPWWLLKKPDIKLRSRDPDFMAACKGWLEEVGRVLGPMQVTRGGPILMVQVENEYGFYGDDVRYMGEMKQALVDGGFDVPLFACNPPYALRKGFRNDLFNVVNFGKDPEGGFKALREVQPKGPLMCGEFYPGWFDTWGFPHHLGNTPQYLADLEYMLKNNASFSIYMAHGGTTFGLWSGADRPFKPDTSSYDYDAPISEAGWIGEKFQLTRDLMARHLLPGETIPEPPAANPVTAIVRFELTESAAVFDNLPTPVVDKAPRNMEAYNQGRGCILYRTTVPAGPAAQLSAREIRDFAWVFLDGRLVGTMDRRSQQYRVQIPRRRVSSRLDILVEAMGHINFGPEVHDRKGLHAPVTLKAADAAAVEPGPWQVYRLPLEGPMLENLRWKLGKTRGPAFWRGTFNVAKPADTFLDVRTWGKGVLWVNGRCMGRFWNIGPTQTMYVPGPWLQSGRNEVIVLDLLGPSEPVLAGLEEPILDQLRPELDFAKKVQQSVLTIEGVQPVHSGTFAPGPAAQDVRFAMSAQGRQFCLETLSAIDGKPFAAVAEIDLLDGAGQPIPHTVWTIAYVDSEERISEDGSALNAINGQTADFWHTEWSQAQPGHPHRLVIDLGQAATITGFRYTPRPGNDSVGGRIKEYRVYVGDSLAKPTAQ
ncbi:MAG TPA: beta-galactosidase [Sedimentisphaerales bacterium]|jgi:beta-galactosidase|nr:beta-galactosidase [Sedimentisphaerales bacterium]HNU30746.1 beta-galactosidase [Sedimentisphaerales bacterium]